MRLVSIAALALLAYPVDALASPACSGPWLPSAALAGCPFVVVEREGYAEPLTTELLRNGEVVADAQIEIIATKVYLDVDYYDITCGTYDVQYVQSEPFVHYSIDALDAQPGDEVVMSGVYGYGTVRVLVQDHAQCPVVPLPSVECYATQSTEDCPGDEIEDPPKDEVDEDLDIDVGCSTSRGVAGLPILLVLGALVRRRRLQSPRSHA
ncbi:MAG TPA: hypothetical protein VIV11_43315 [Kofleriaceae bacterium]